MVCRNDGLRAGSGIVFRRPSCYGKVLIVCSFRADVQSLFYLAYFSPDVLEAGLVDFLLDSVVFH